jgi:hypothetical protein
MADEILKAPFTVRLPQEEYRQFKRRINILQKNGINLDYSVAQPNKRVVKITMHKDYNWDMLDEVCEACT